MVKINKEFHCYLEPNNYRVDYSNQEEAPFEPEPKFEF